jgi:hypothetical protein
LVEGEGVRHHKWVVEEEGEMEMEGQEGEMASLGEEMEMASLEVENEMACPPSPF